MSMHRGIIWVMACMGVLACISQARAQERPFESLDQQQLIDALDQAGMRELLQAQVARLQARGDFDAFELRALEAKLQLAEGRAIMDDPERRRAVIDGALAIYRELIDSLEPTNYIEQTRLYELQAAWAWGVIDDRCREYTDRLKQLRAGPADYQDLLDLLAPLDEDLPQPVFTLEDLKTDISRTLREIRSGGAPGDEYVIAVPRLTALQLRVDYYVSWGNYWFVVGMLNEPEEDQVGNDQLLVDAMDYIAPFVENEELNVQDPAILLTAMCRRQLGQTAGAIDILRPLVNDDTLNVWFRVEAVFESARCYAETGDRVRFDEMLRLLGTTCADQIGGESGRVQMLFYTMLLERYYQLVQGDPVAAERVLVDFFEAHEDLQWSLLNMADEMYRGVEDEDAPAIVLLARAYKAVDEGTTESAQEALELCDLIETMSGPLAAPFSARAQGLRQEVDPRPPTLDDVRQYLEMIADDPTNDRVMAWVGNAAHKANLILSAARANGEFGEASVPAEVRDVFGQVMDTILSRADWLEADPYLARWYLDAGYNLYWQAAARELDDRAASDALYARAIEMWEQYPAEMGDRDMSVGHFEARFAALELRRYLLRRRILMDEDLSEADARRAAEDLRQMLVSYTNEVHSRWTNMPAGADKDALEEWGSKAGFWAAEFAYEPVGDIASASQEVEALATRWSENSPVLSNAAELAIRIDVDRGQVDSAMARLDDFTRENPDRSVELINLVINQIRNSIAELRHEPGREAELDAQRRSYFALADEMFREVEALPVEDRYRETQMYADALSEYALAEGDPSYAQRGLELIGECFALREDEREAVAQAIDAEFDQISQRLRELNAMPGLAGRREGLDTARQELQASLEAEGFDLETWTPWLMVDAAWQAVVDEPGDLSEEERQRNLDQVALELGMAYERRRVALLGRRPVDPENFFGEARCNAAAGNYLAAHARLQELGRMLSPQLNHDLYWETQLQRVLAGKEAFWDDAENLQALLGSITQLDDRTRSFFGGGSNARAFRTVRTEIQERIEELNQR